MYLGIGLYQLLYILLPPRDHIGNPIIPDDNHVSMKRSCLFFLLSCIPVIFIVGCSGSADPAGEYMEKGIALKNQGMYEEAIKAFDQVIEMNPNDTVAWNNKGAVLILQGNGREALQAYDQTIRIDPNDSLAWDGRGSSYHLQGNYNKALDSFDQAIQINPADPQAWYRKGATLLQLGWIEESIQAFDQALLIDPNYPDAERIRELAKTRRNK
jgi:tetratricopeptide (TPR) repeat protein